MFNPNAVQPGCGYGAGVSKLTRGATSSTSLESSSRRDMVGTVVPKSLTRFFATPELCSQTLWFISWAAPELSRHEEKCLALPFSSQTAIFSQHPRVSRAGSQAHRISACQRRRKNPHGCLTKRKWPRSEKNNTRQEFLFSTSLSAHTYQCPGHPVMKSG